MSSPGIAPAPFNRRDFLRLSALALGGSALAACQGQFLSLLKDDERPNFLFIVTDDQRFDTMGYMPRTQELIFDQGVTFENGVITTPLCGPSRCSILTGLYAHTHGIYDNDDETFSETTFLELLHENDYYTGLVGKYLNTWKGEPRPEFDFWVAFAKGQSRYNNPRLNVNGEWFRHQDRYITYALGDYTLEFLEKAARQREPFCLFFAPNAPHEPATPAPEDKYLELELPPRRPNFNEPDVTDKPEWFAAEPPLNESEIQELDVFIREQILCLYSLDRVVAEIVKKLRELGMLDQTAIFFLSDNGKQWGEHRLRSKNSFYEETIRVPFALRYPPLFSPAQVEARVVANIDIAPTVLELAGISQATDRPMDGLSLTGLTAPEDSWREGVLIEGDSGRGVYAAYRTSRYLYAETVGESPEFYDLQQDPYQLENGIDRPEYQETIQHMRAAMDALRTT